MTTRSLKNLLIVFLILALSACQQKQDSSVLDQVIHINPEEFTNPPEKGEDWIETIKFIRLETIKGIYVPSDSRYKIRGDYILIGNSNLLMIFRKNGKYICSINAKGGGPEEYRNIADYELIPDKEEIVICGEGHMLFYTVSGEFIEKQSIPLKSDNIAALGQGYFGFALERFYKGREDSVGKYQLIITDRQGNILDRKFEFPYYIYSGGSTMFCKTADMQGSLCTLLYNLNIYQLGPGPIIKSKYKIDFGIYNPDTSMLQEEKVEKDPDLYLYNENKMLKPYGISETGNTLLVRCGSNKHQKIAYQLINLKSRNQKTVVMEKPPVLDHFHGWPVYPYLSSSGDYIFHASTALDISESLQNLTNDEKKALSQYKGFKELEQVKENDNPVLVLYEVKDF